MSIHHYLLSIIHLSTHLPLIHLPAHPCPLINSQSLHLPIHLSIHSLTHLPIYPPIQHTSSHPGINPCMHPSIHHHPPIQHTSSHPGINLCMHACIHLSIITHPSSNASIHLSVFPFAHPVVTQVHFHRVITMCQVWLQMLRTPQGTIAPSYGVDSRYHSISEYTTGDGCMGEWDG